MQFRWHFIMLILVGYLIGYYWRALGNMTVAKVLPSAGA